MKTLKIMLLVAIAIVAIACNQTKNNAITGTYVASSKNEYTLLNDTLIIKTFDAGSNTFHIEKRSGYNLIREGKVLPKEYKSKTWNATYDEQKHLLSETALGKQIYINTDGGTLSFGATYRKIK